ncbi:MAG: DUF1932 domain-containing protein [Actinomycetota bacterium]
MRIGLLHPGQMGAVIGAELTSAQGRAVCWASAGRSEASGRRAKTAGLDDLGSVEALAAACEVVLSICPPEEASAVAERVAAAGFTGTYVDANAVAPATARAVGERFDRFVDGGIVGPPPTDAGTTRLYLSGDEAPAVAELFASTTVEARVVDGGAGAASAVKMCFAAWTKGTAALLLSIRALADAEGVTDDLLGEWATSMPEMAARSEHHVRGAGPKAWRFAGEMEEIAATFAAADLPDGFHLGAAEAYRRLAPLKGVSSPDLATAIELLRRG